MLSVSGLTVSYGAVRALRGISLEVGQGELVALLGPNGAGKTSTLGALMGLRRAGGTVRLDDRPVLGRAPEQIVRLGMTLVPEGRRVFGRLTVAENLRLGAASQPDEEARRRQYAEVHSLFPVLEERSGQLAGSLSGGEQQQLAIARALMSGPRLLLLDEPSLGLAPKVVDTIFGLIERLRARGLTVLLVEQNVDRSLEIADRGYVLVGGEIVLAGAAKELLQSPDVQRAYLGLAS
jgi:branched-chain amino acid transport system ATP-binding protein